MYLRLRCSVIHDLYFEPKPENAGEKKKKRRIAVSMCNEFIHLLNTLVQRFIYKSNETQM